MEKYYGQLSRNVNNCTTPLGLETVNLCSVRGRRTWFANLVSVLHLLQRGAEVDLLSQGAGIRNKSNGKNLYTASRHHGVYARDIWTRNSFLIYHVSP
jgi:hypothetical protein